MADDTNPHDRPVVTRAKARAAGLKRFYTGNPCLKGHVAERQVSNNTCMSCAAARMLAKYAPKPRKHHIQDAKSTGAKRYFTGKPCPAGHVALRRVASHGCVTCEAAKRAAHRKANPEKNLIRAAAYRLANKEKIRASHAAWLEANRKQQAAYSVIYRAANAVKRRAWQSARRARKCRSPGRYSAADVCALLKLQRSKCAHPWCRKSLAVGYHVDHVIPLSLGGSNDRSNLQVLCPRCNTHKNDTHPVDYAQRHGMLL